MSNENAPFADDNRPAVGGPVQRPVRPAVAVAHGGDEHLTLLGAPYHWNLLTGVDRADMLAFGRACMEAERERWSEIVRDVQYSQMLRPSCQKGAVDRCRCLLCANERWAAIERRA